MISRLGVFGSRCGPTIHHQNFTNMKNSECLNPSARSKHHSFNGLVCILRIASTKNFFSSCGLYNVHEKSLIERECELKLIIRSIEGRGKKDLIFLHTSTTSTLKPSKFGLSLWTFDNSITKNYM